MLKSWLFLHNDCVHGRAYAVIVSDSKLELTAYLKTWAILHYADVDRDGRVVTGAVPESK